MKIKKHHFVAILFLGFVGLVVAAVLFTHISFYRIPTVAMEPTLKKGDLIVAESVTYLFRAPATGDVIAFQTRGIPGIDSNSVFAKRLVGLPGETITIKKGKAYIDGVPFSNSSIRYVNLPISEYCSSDSDSFKIPPKAYFVLGDNSTNSFDSRFFGAVPETALISKVAFRYWPFSRIGCVK